MSVGYELAKPKNERPQQFTRFTTKDIAAMRKFLDDAGVVETVNEHTGKKLFREAPGKPWHPCAGETPTETEMARAWALDKICHGYQHGRLYANQRIYYRLMDEDGWDTLDEDLHDRPFVSCGYLPHCFIGGNFIESMCGKIMDSRNTLIYCHPDYKFPAWVIRMNLSDPEYPFEFLAWNHYNWREVGENVQARFRCLNSLRNYCFIKVKVPYFGTGNVSSVLGILSQGKHGPTAIVNDVCVRFKNWEGNPESFMKFNGEKFKQFVKK